MKLLTGARLNQAIAALAPIHGVSVGTFGNAATCEIQFLPEATAPQRTAAAAALAAFDWSDSATEAWEAQQNPNRTALRNALAAALAANANYIALANPNAAQSTAQVKALAQQMNAVLRRLADLS